MSAERGKNIAEAYFFGENYDATYKETDNFIFPGAGSFVVN